MSVAPRVAFCFIGAEPLDQGASKQEDLELQAALPKPADLLAKLVAFDTTSAKSNLELIDFVRDALASHGVTSTLTPSPDGVKASLFATIGPEGEGGIGLSGHSDCVPVEGQTWTSDPFTLELRDGKLYGRGACDMKGFLACVLASVPLFTARTLKEPIHIIVSYDEEVGCTGVRPLIARLGKDLPRPRAVIVGEPTSMTVIEAHKRIDAYRTTVTGKEAHSSLPQLGVNAISVAAELIEEIDRIGADLAASDRRSASIRPSRPCRSAPSRAARRRTSCRRPASSNGRCGACQTPMRTTCRARLKAFADERLLPRMRRVAETAAIETQHLGGVPAFLAKPRIGGRRLSRWR